MQQKIKAVLYTKPDCGLCKKMKAEMKLADCEELYALEEVNIESDPELCALYRYEIPVLCINGVEAFRHRIAADEFKAYITSLFSHS